MTVANALAAETSPYLLQHADNPVDWVAWGPEVLTRARDLDRPVLVSIGYSACHWCHVMAHESFEDPDTAAAMNAGLLCVKVDREERPDVDAVCMEACQRLTGQGGWPLNVFLTPEGEPFFAGTYFPPEPRHGLVSWRTVVDAVTAAWRDRPAAVREQAAQLSAAIATSAAAIRPGPPVAPAALTAAVASLSADFDRVHGGWGGAPKFPPHTTLEFLLARAAGGDEDGAAARDMAVTTLTALADGGIYDQVGGGFHRYTVDGTWTVPHFEKMLYDNALLARAFLRGHQLTGDPRLRTICTETLDFCLRELGRDDGGFASALDADSEGVEGRFYVWTLEQLEEALRDGQDLSLVSEAVPYFLVTPEGNFEGTNVLRAHGPAPARREEIRRRLLEARARRVRPGRDDKRVTAWNALMIAALADAGTVLSRPDYLEAGRRCAEALLAGEQLSRIGTGPAFLDDYAYLVEALVSLYEATWEPRWYHAAIHTADEMVARFADPEHGGFYTTPDGHDDLVGRRRDLEDAPVPAGSSAAALGLLRLARLAGSVDFERAALGVLAAHGPIAARHPHALGHLLTALDFHLADVREVAVVGAGPDGTLANVVRARYRPHAVLAGTASDGVAADGSDVPLLEHRGLVGGRPAAYVCERFACQAPVSEPGELAARLGD